MQVQVDVVDLAAPADLADDRQGEAVSPGRMLLSQVDEVVLLIGVGSGHVVEVLDLLLQCDSASVKGCRNCGSPVVS